jgi:hypothetical protein
MEETLWRDLWKRNSEPDAQQALEERSKHEQNYRLKLRPIPRGISRMREQFSKTLVFLTGAVGLLLIGICANVAGLLVARSQ